MFGHLSDDFHLLFDGSIPLSDVESRILVSMSCGFILLHHATAHVLLVLLLVFVHQDRVRGVELEVVILCLRFLEVFLVKRVETVEEVHIRGRR